jgi:peptidoglycan-N-acetylglucosamine deacetylase
VRNCLTVDVEEWFHVCGIEARIPMHEWSRLDCRVVRNTQALLELLNRCGVRATFFVLGWVAHRYPALVRDIQSAGHEIGSHGYSHRRVYELTSLAFSDDVQRSRMALADAGCPEVTGYRAPEWSINGRALWALGVLAELGFRYDSSMAPLRLVGDPAFPQRPHVRSTSSGDLLEFPPLVGRRFGQNVPLGFGWGLRMTPPSRVRAAIIQRNREHSPVALSVHPWEIDPEPPRVQLPWQQSFAHYFRLSGFADRLERILKEHAFAPMGEVLELLPAEA